MADPAIVRAELARVLASASFASTERLRRFLRYIVEETVEGRGDSIKEYAVGVSVFGKPSDYDPKTDATVRGEASRLRGRLAEYYSREASDARLEFRLPKGSYVPLFVPRTPENGGSVIRSLAVLPFLSLTRNGGDEDGLALGLAFADAVITRIGSWGDLIVRPTSAVRRYIDARCDALEAAHRLQTDVIAEGCYQLVGNRMRVSVQLLESSTGRHLWTGQYDVSDDDILAIQDAIAEQVARALRIPLAGPGTTRSAGRVPPEAYAHFARGRHHLLRFTPQANASATAELQRAVGLNSDFAIAHAYLALSRLQEAELMQTPHDAVMNSAKAHIDQALALDPEGSETLAALAAFQFRCLWRWQEAEATCRRANELNPSHLQTCLEYGALLDCLGRFDDGLEMMRKALRLDPASPLVHIWFSVHHWFKHEYQEAIDWARAALRLDPHFLLAHERIAAYLLKTGAVREWAHHLLRAFALWHEGSPWINRIQQDARDMGPRDLIEALIDREHAPESLGAAWFAMIYAEIGDTDLALACLEGAFQQRLGALVYLAVDPSWDSLRSDTRFKDLLRRMRLDDVPARIHDR